MNLRFSQSVLAVLAAAASLVVGGSVKGASRQKANDVCNGLTVDALTLPPDSRNAFNVDVFVDVYNCNRSKSKPLIVFASGTVKKEEYSKMAGRLATEGYVIMIIEHPSVFGTTEFNLPTPVDISNSIILAKDKVSSGEWQGVDTDTILLMGHSFGTVTVLSALSGRCSFFLCGDSPFSPPVPVPLDGAVKGGIAFGAATFDPVSQQFNRFDDKPDLPFAYANGSGDSVTFRIDPVSGDSVALASYDITPPSKSYLVVDQLDHYSIANILPPVNARGDIPSMLPRDEQIDAVVNILTSHATAILSGNYVRNETLCKYVTQRGKVGKENPNLGGFDVLDCREESSN